MIEKCNFKNEIKKDIYSETIKTWDKGTYCLFKGIGGGKCEGEEKCVFFQTYKLLNGFLNEELKK